MTGEVRIVAIIMRLSITVLVICLTFLVTQGFSFQTIKGKHSLDNVFIEKEPRTVLVPVLVATMLGSMACFPLRVNAAGDVARGQELFEMNCNGCHMGGQNFVRPNKTMQAEALQKFLGGTDQPTLEKFVKNSMHPLQAYPKMPGGKMMDQDWTDVTAYVSDQAINNKW